jgi:hypothetical protein
VGTTYDRASNYREPDRPLSFGSCCIRRVGSAAVDQVYACSRSRDRDQRFHYVRLQLGRVDVTGGRVGLDNLRICYALACGMGVE